MKKIMLGLLFFGLFFIGNLQAQVIKGTLKNDATQEPAPAVSIQIKNSTEGTFSDDRGRFLLTTNKKLPVTLVVSSIGFETKEVLVQSFSEPVAITIRPSVILGQEVVVSASRRVQKKLSSP